MSYSNFELVIFQLKRARVPPHDLALFYISCVRSVIDHAVPAFDNALPQYLKNELLRLEKRALSIITSGGARSSTAVGHKTYVRSL